MAGIGDIIPPRHVAESSAPSPEGAIAPNRQNVALTPCTPWIRYEWLYGLLGCIAFLHYRVRRRRWFHGDRRSSSRRFGGFPDTPAADSLRATAPWTKAGLILAMLSGLIILSTDAVASWLYLTMLAKLAVFRSCSRVQLFLARASSGGHRHRRGHETPSRLCPCCFGDVRGVRRNLLRLHLVSSSTKMHGIGDVPEVVA